MTSNIDPTVPSGPIAYTADMRRNFATAKSEITALQVATANPVTSVAGRVGAIILSHIDISDWNASTALFGLWNAGSVVAVGPSLNINAGGTLNAAASSAQKFLGNYNALTNTPSIGALGTGSGGGVNGNTWVVNVAGTVAADSVGAVNPSDQIVNTGSLWVRQAYSTSYGSMAIQNANSVNITNGLLQGTVIALGTFSVTSGPSTFQIVPGSTGGEAHVDPYGALGWQFDPFANLLMAGSVVAGSGILLSQTSAAIGPLKVNIGVGGLAHIDPYGAVGELLDPNGNLAISGSIVGGGFTLSGTGVSGPGISNSIFSTAANNPGSAYAGMLVLDRYGAVGLIADPAAAPIPYANTLPPTTYDAGVLARRDAAALAASGADKGMQSPYAQKPTFGYNFWMVYGQSQSVGAVGSPALTKAQPTDALMLGPFGISSQGGVIGTGTIWVSPDNNFHPAVATDQPVGLLHTGMIPNMGTISLAGSGSSGIITQTGGSSVAWNSIFVATDYFGFTGWPAPNTALNNDTSSAPWNAIGTVTSVSPTSLSFTVGSGIAISPASGVSTVSIQQISHAGNGERQEIEAVTLFRKLSLDTKQLPADPTRLLVTAATGHGGQYIEQLRPQPSNRNWQCYITQALTGQVDAVDTNAGQMTITGVSAIQDTNGKNYVLGVDYSVSGANITWITARPPGRKYIANVTFSNQNSWGIPVTASQTFKTTAGGLGATSGVFMITYWQGTSDGGATTYAGYMASLAGLIADFEAQVVAGVFGQSRSPVYLIIPDSATNLTEPLGLINDPTGMCVAQANLDTALNPPIPTVYLLGGTYAMPRYGFHLMGNGYRWLGALVAKVAHQIIDLGANWKPLHMTQATFRGNQVLIDFYVPVPPIQIQPFFRLPGGSPTIWPDWGFLVIDALGVVPINTIALNGAATVLLTLARVPSGSAIVRYADGANHTGAGNICDSDPAVSDVPWIYSPGNGQWPAENAPGWVGKPFPLWNWCSNAAVPLINA